MSTETTEVTGRTFHNSDYRAAARLIQGMRHVKGNRYQPKPDQSFVDMLASDMAAVFQRGLGSVPAGRTV